MPLATVDDHIARAIRHDIDHGMDPDAALNGLASRYNAGLDKDKKMSMNDLASAFGRVTGLTPNEYAEIRNNGHLLSDYVSPT